MVFVVVFDLLCMSFVGYLMGVWIVVCVVWCGICGFVFVVLVDLFVLGLNCCDYLGKLLWYIDLMVFVCVGMDVEGMCVFCLIWIDVEL